MDESSALRRKDTTKGLPLRILSLDGGGVRGLSMLIILQELMHKTFVEIEGRAPKREEIPRPCDHFDLIAGTGTGGLIAIMLGRLRLDLDTCKDLYVRMTRRVFETDKTIAGIPYRSTLFKASKLEEAIKDTVRKHTMSDAEGNDSLASATPMTPDTASFGMSPSSPGGPQRSTSQSSKYSQFGMSPVENKRTSFGSLQFGNANALLYDERENRTKTAVTAAFRGTPNTTLLRSYDSRKEPAPDVKCTIWQAGRATSATAMAFKPIQIGQSWYLDEGAGKYNPAPLVLDESAQNEWPGRDVGVFVSIGTGKRPAGTNNQQHEWWEGFLGGSMGDFAEARRRLISKLEGCEETHQYMLREHLMSRGVNVENYYRLNVEVGVGEFGMNEWARLSEIGTNTRTYLAKKDVSSMNQSASSKLARIHMAKMRHERTEARGNGMAGGAGSRPYSFDDPWNRPLPVAQPAAVELPGDDSYYRTQGFRPGAQHYEHRPSVGDQKYMVVGGDYHAPQQSTPTDSASARTPPQRPVQPAGANVSPYQSPQFSSPGRTSYDAQQRPSPPPLPPKTPINSLPYPDQTSPVSPQMQTQTERYGGGGGPRTFMNMGDLGRKLPYPDVDGPPPPVNTANKPQISR